MRVIIIGGGIAGTTAAEEIRSRDPKAEITIISAEQHPCYSRVLLPHYVKGKIGREKVFLRQLSSYTEKNIEFMAGVRVKEIDIKNKFVLTSEDRELPFDVLLLTTGTDVDLLLDDRRGVAYLSTIEDADGVLELIHELKALPKESQQAFVYGGGFIAIEFINIFDHFGIPYAVAMRGTGFWSRVLSEHSQKLLLDHARAKGVTVYTNEPNLELLGDEELMGIRLKDGKDIPVKMLGVGIGVHANDQTVIDAGVPCGVGIFANEFLETSIKGVYTAGDAAEFHDPNVGRYIRYGNWMNALMQGKAVGRVITGERAPFSLISSYATNLLGMHVVFIGDVNRDLADKVVQSVSTPEASEEIFVRDGRCIGAILVGDVKNRAKLTAAIGKPYAA